VSESSESLEPHNVDTTSEQAESVVEAAQPEPGEPEQPETVPASYGALKRWTFLLVLLPVWIPAAAGGLGLYYWWFHSLYKTWPVYVVLIFVAVCTIAGLLVAMTGRRPVVSAIAIAVMTAPYAATIAASVLHGLYYCDRMGHCLVGLIPY
jgi:hypothetical protein